METCYEKYDRIIILHMAANGNKTMLINPIFQEGASLNNLTIKPDKRRNRKLYLETPSIPVLSKGNNEIHRVLNHP
jgi:hypothetical protein